MTANDDLEQVFQSIEQGNNLRDDKKYWEAAAAYTQARRQLLTLLHHQRQQQQQEQQDNTAEANRIQQLYQQQARDYLHRARETLLDALRQEDENDRKVALHEQTYYEKICNHNDNDDSGGGNDDDDNNNKNSLERLRLFAWLFSNEKILDDPTSSKTSKQGADKHREENEQFSLEDRLRALNASLPKNLKSDDERMLELNRGLKNLGISVPNSSSSNSAKPQELFEANAKSESDQVEDIIAQAKDEARMEANTTSESLSCTGSLEQPNSNNDNNDDINKADEAEKLMDSMIDAVEASKDIDNKEENDNDSAAKEDDDDDNSDNDAIDNPFTSTDLAYFQDRVNEAQASLAELNAMLDGADEGEDADILFDPDTGRHALDSALRYLQQVQKRWKEAKKRT